MKRFIYEFDGKIWLDAKNQDEAENILIEILKKKRLNKFVVDEDVYQVDQFFVANDLKKRKRDWGSFYHPALECDQYSEYRKRYRRYGDIFKNFLHGKIDKEDLIKRMDQADAERESLEDCDPIVELQAFDLEGELKTVRHYYIGEK